MNSVPLVGDFNGDGITDVGIYVPTANVFALDELNALGQSIGQNVFSYGYHYTSYSIPLVGDFNGDGISDVGIYVPTTNNFALDLLNSQGKSMGQDVFSYGYHTSNTFAVPIVGDFNGDGISDVGVYIPDKDVFRLT